MVRFADPDRLGPREQNDLRRRGVRDRSELILMRAAHLEPEDRRLLEVVFSDGLTCNAVAELRRESPRKIRRRVRALVERVTSDRYAFVTRERDRWPATRRRVATACVLQGRSFREAAEQLRLTFHTVRRHMNAVEAIFEAADR